MSIDLDLSFLIQTFDAAPDPSALAGVLFADEFDLEVTPATTDAAPQEAPSKAPLHDEAALLAARVTGFEEGQAIARADGAARLSAASEAALAALAVALGAATEAARKVAADAADRLAAEMMRALAAALPELCTQHGAAEALALAAALLPMLQQQPRIVVRANPHTLAALQACIAGHQGATPGRIAVIATDALPEGDISLEWEDGAAVRDSASLCRSLAAMLAPIGVGLPPASHHGDARQGASERELAHAG